MDFRLTRDIHDWLASKNLVNDCDIISVAGIAKAIADDPDSADAQFVLKQIALSKKLHDTKIIYLMHHTDCGAYGGHSAFSDLVTEKTKYREDMQKAKGVIEGLVSGVEVKFAIADILDNGRVEIKEV